MDDVKWNKLYERLNKVRMAETKICIHREDGIIIDIKELGHEESGCGGCNQRYDSFRLRGNMTVVIDGHIDVEYEASVSQYNMHICPKSQYSDSNPESFCPLIRCKVWLPIGLYIQDVYLELDDLK
jgi:hypothetical protein